MITNPFVDRVLSFEVDGKEETISHRDILTRSENLIVLGEAGMGKSRLLEELESGAVKRITARRFIHGLQSAWQAPDVDCVLIDALDEAPAFSDGSVVDQIVAKLEQVRSLRFVLTCRAEEWQAATSRSVILEAFGAPPLELRLKPFDQAQVRAFLTGQLGAPLGEEVYADYEALSLGEWLGNPQTLSMLADVTRLGKRPKTTSELFEAYVDLALLEANPVRQERHGSASRLAVLDTLGAAFAGLILSGKAALAPNPSPLDDDTLALADLETLPGFTDWSRVAGNRLIRILDPATRRLTYAHRRIGEWLGARWLAQRLEHSDALERILSAVAGDGVVPASLRGLVGWLARDAALTPAILALDPMAVVEYGDADVLSGAQAKQLLTALDRMSQSDPWFAGWRDFRARALVGPAVLDESLALVCDETKSDRLRLMVARQLSGAHLDAVQIRMLLSLVLDRNRFFALRSEVGSALIKEIDLAQQREIVEGLRREATNDATRLAADLLLDIGVAAFSDVEVVEVLFAACGQSIASLPQEPESSMGLRGWRFRYEIPDDRLDGILDLLADYALALLPEYRSLESADIIGVGDALIARRLAIGPVEPAQLLRWLQGFGGRDSYTKEDEEAISDFLAGNDDVRRGIQRLWLDSKPDEDAFLRAVYDLGEVHRILALDDADVAALLDRLPQSTTLWRAAARLTKHSASEGVRTRAAVKRFMRDGAEYDALVSELLNPPKPGWQVRNEARAAAHEAEREDRWRHFREGLDSEILLVEHGSYGVILQVALAYTGQYSDLRNIPTAEERLSALCGAALVPAIYAGFEAYLDNLPSYPDAGLIAKSYAKHRAWNARYILIAALSARLAHTGSLGHLTRDQLISAQIHIANQTVNGEEWASLRDAIWASLVQDAEAFEEYGRLLVEPPLRKGSEFISGLYEFLHDGRKAQADLVGRLAADWLTRFPRMHARPEEELLSSLIQHRACDAILPVAARRLRSVSLADERRRNWQAAALICDFEQYQGKLVHSAQIDPALLWNIRSLLGARRPYVQGPTELSVRLAAWLVKNFRGSFPAVGRPGQVTMGDTNPWDGTEALGRLIDRIGTDPTSEAEALLEDLAATRDGYRERILAVLAELRRTRAELSRLAVSPAQLAAILSNGPPVNLLDLQRKALRLLEKVEALASNNDTDSWVTFYKDDRKTPLGEEQCRDRVIDYLRGLEGTIKFSPEKHLGGDREGDIACEYGAWHLPIEVKGQWHDDLWSAADAQLAAQQASDHLAQGYGIFLVLWFGPNGKPLKGPPRGSGLKPPKTPTELEIALSQHSPAVRCGKIRVKVINLSRG